MADTRQKLFLGESGQSSSGIRNYFVSYLHEGDGTKCEKVTVQNVKVSLLLVSIRNSTPKTVKEKS